MVTYPCALPRVGTFLCLSFVMLPRRSSGYHAIIFSGPTGVNVSVSNDCPFRAGTPSLPFQFTVDWALFHLRDISFISRYER